MHTALAFIRAKCSQNKSFICVPRCLPWMNLLRRMPEIENYFCSYKNGASRKTARELRVQSEGELGASTTNSGFLPASSLHTRETNQVRRVFLREDVRVRTWVAASMGGGGVGGTCTCSKARMTMLVVEVGGRIVRGTAIQTRKLPNIFNISQATVLRLPS